MEGSDVLAPDDIASFSSQLTTWEEGLSPEELPLSDWLFSVMGRTQPTVRVIPGQVTLSYIREQAEQASQQRSSRLCFSSFPSPGSCLEFPL